MKTRDLVYLVLAVVILLVAGYLAFTLLMPGSTTSTKSGVQVERVGDIPANLQGAGYTILAEGKKAVDYNSPTDLSGLGNKAPFGQ